MEFFRPEYWSGEPFPSQGDLPNPGAELGSPALQADSLPAELPGKPCKRPRMLLNTIQCMGQSPTEKNDPTPSVDGMKDEKPWARPQRLSVLTGESGKLFSFPSVQPRRRSQVHSQLLPRTPRAVALRHRRSSPGDSGTRTAPLEGDSYCLTLRRLQEPRVQHIQVQSRPASGDGNTDIEIFTPSLVIDDLLQTANNSRCWGNNKEQSSFLCLYEASSLRRVRKHTSE